MNHSGLCLQLDCIIYVMYFAKWLAWGQTYSLDRNSAKWDVQNCVLLKVLVKIWSAEQSTCTSSEAYRTWELFMIMVKIKETGMLSTESPYSFLMAPLPLSTASLWYLSWNPSWTRKEIQNYKMGKSVRQILGILTCGFLSLSLLIMNPSWIDLGWHWRWLFEVKLCLFS